MYFISVVDGNKRDKGSGVGANNGSIQKKKKLRAILFLKKKNLIVPRISPILSQTRITNGHGTLANLWLCVFPEMAG